MAVNKVELANGTVLMDSSGVTVTPGDMLTGVTAMSANGQIVTGSLGDFSGTDGTNPGTAGLVPAPTTSDTNTFLCSDGTWSSVSGGTNYSAFSGADGTNGGTSGLVPAPTATDNTKFLKGNGSWGLPDEVTTSRINEILASNTSAVQIVTAELSDVLRAVYPIGSYYTSDYSTSPASLFGGTWERVNGRFLFGAGENEANTDTTYGSMSAGTVNVSAGAMGGEAQHKLASAEMADHFHDVRLPDDQSGYSSTIPANSAYLVYSTAVKWTSSQLTGRNVHRYYSEYGAGTAGTYSAQSGANRSVGESHNNMPPYKAVYIWHRIA